MKKLLVLCVCLLLPAAVWGETIFDGYVETSTPTAAPAGIVYAVGPAGGGGTYNFHDYVAGDLGPTWNFNVASAGTLDIHLLDCCIVGDVYEVILDGVFVGRTLEVPMGGATLSSGTFAGISILAGAHTLDVWDVTLSYLGSDSPFGGGLVTSIMSPGGGYLTVDFNPVPEPASLVLLGTGLVGLAGRARKLLKR